MSFVSEQRTRHSALLLQILATLIGGPVLFFMGAAAIASGYQLIFSERVFPGISMAGVDLSNLTPEQATLALNQRLSYPTSGRIVFRDGERVWLAAPAELGMTFDAGTSVQRAYGLGRGGGLLANLAAQLNAWQGGLELAPVIQIDARMAHAYLQNIAAQVDRPVLETELRVDGTQVFYTPGQTGRLVNVDKALASLLAQLETFRDGEISLYVEEQPPLILDASAQAGVLRQALS